MQGYKNVQSVSHISKSVVFNHFQKFKSWLCIFQMSCFGRNSQILNKVKSNRSKWAFYAKNLANLWKIAFKTYANHHPITMLLLRPKQLISVLLWLAYQLCWFKSDIFDTQHWPIFWTKNQWEIEYHKTHENTRQSKAVKMYMINILEAAMLVY